MKNKFNVVLCYLFAAFALFNTIRVFAGGQTWQVPSGLVSGASSTENSYSYVTYGSGEGGSIIYWGTNTINKPVTLQMEGQEDIMCNKQIRGLYISPDARGNVGRPIDQETLNNYISTGFDGYDQLHLTGGFFTDCNSSESTLDSQSVFGYIGYEMGEGENVEQGPKIWAGVTGMESDPISLSWVEDLKIYGLGTDGDVVATGYVYEAGRGRGSSEGGPGVNIGINLSGSVTLLESDIYYGHGCPQNGCTTKTGLVYFVNINEPANLYMRGPGMKNTINIDIQESVGITDPMIELTNGNGLKEFYYNLSTGSQIVTGKIIVELREQNIITPTTGNCIWNSWSNNPINSGESSQIKLTCTNYSGFNQSNFSVSNTTFGNILNFDSNTNQGNTTYKITVKAFKGNGIINLNINGVPNHVLLASTHSPNLTINPDPITPPTPTTGSCSWEERWDPNPINSGGNSLMVLHCTNYSGFNQSNFSVSNASFGTIANFDNNTNHGITTYKISIKAIRGDGTIHLNVSGIPSHVVLSSTYSPNLTINPDPVTPPTPSTGLCSWNFWSPSSINSGENSQITLLCSNASELTQSNFRLNTINTASGYISNFSKNSVGNSTTYTIVVRATRGGGQISISPVGVNSNISVGISPSLIVLSDEPSVVTHPTCGVSYNPTAGSITNGNVVASLSSCNTGITVTNNNGSNSFVFTNNGSFTFEFRDSLGNTGSTAATVRWIDKNSPVCSRGSPSITMLNGGETGQITLTCTDERGIATNTIYSNQITSTNSLLTFSDAYGQNQNNSTTKTFTFVYTAKYSVNGSDNIRLPANIVSDVAGNSNAENTSSSSITVSNNVGPATGLVYFSDGVFSSWTQSDTIVIGGTAPTKMWKFNNNNYCDSNTSTYTTLPANGQIIVNDESHNGQYICILGQNGYTTQVIVSDYPISIDRTLPNIELRPAVISGSSLTFNRSGSDSPSGISGYSINIAHRNTNGVINSNTYGPFVANVSSYTIHNFVDGDYRWSIIAEDVAGNTKVANGADFTITNGMIGGYATQIKFDTINNADINEYYKSSTGIVSGLANNTTAIASLSGGALFINGRFVGSTGQVRNNDTINIEMKSSSQYDTATTGVLNINSVLSTFTIHTKPGINFQNLTGMTPMQKIQGILFVDSLAEMYKADQTKLARFLSTFLQVLQDQSDLYAKKIADARNESEKTEYTIYKQSVDFLYLIVKDRLNNLDYKDYSIYIAPNGKQYVVKYDEDRFAYTSPDFNRTKYFPTWESFKNHIDINNPKKGSDGIMGNMIVAHNGKTYTIYQKNGKWTSDGFSWYKYFDTKEDIVNHIFANNPASDRDHRIDQNFKKVEYRAPKAKKKKKKNHNFYFLLICILNVKTKSLYYI